MSALPAAEAGPSRRLLACDPSKCAPQAWPLGKASELQDGSKDCEYWQNSCCKSCWVYENYSAKVQGHQWAYSDRVHPDQKPDVSSRDHVLVVPAPACTGVEAWNTAACGFEYIWDAAWRLITAAGKDRTKAMAINGQHTRGQHQMHIHVADIQRSLGSWFSTLPVDGTWHSTACTGTSPLKCSGSAGSVSAACKAVHPGKGPSDATPFETVYTHSYDANSSAKTITLVFSPSADVFCVAKMDDRPAECLLYCPQSGDCSTSTKLSCP